MRAFWAIVVLELILGGVLFGSAGRVDLPWFWALIGIHTAVLAINLSLMEPGLREERMSLKRRGGCDRSMRVMLLPFVVAHVVVAGLDVGRFGWSGPVRWEVHVVGLVGYCAGVALAVWAMAVNRFFAPVVRIQSERGHHVISGGPYAFVRHPAYLGFLIALVAEAFMLGSYWCLAPLIGAVVVIMKRTVLEDRFLHESLVGYREYARAVRYRMARGVW